ncbi:Os03g0228901, partial [Oryza sativa Japonica Group]
TGSNVAVGAGDRGHALGATGIAAEELGEAEVGDVRLELGVEEDVVGLDVAVQDRRRAVVVQVAEALGGLHGDLVPRRPLQVAALLAVEHLAEAAVRHVLVHQQVRLPVGGEPEQAHDVSVPDAPQRLYLRREAVVVVRRAGAPHGREPLHGHHRAAGHRALVHDP